MRTGHKKRTTTVMDQHFIAWWNLENLFDEEGSPDPSDRPEWLTKAEKID